MHNIGILLLSYNIIWTLNMNVHSYIDTVPPIKSPIYISQHQMLLRVNWAYYFTITKGLVQRPPFNNIADLKLWV